MLQVICLLMDAFQPLQICYAASVEVKNRVDIERLRTKFYYYVLNRTKIVIILG